MATRKRIQIRWIFASGDRNIAVRLRDEIKTELDRIDEDVHRRDGRARISEDTFGTNWTLIAHIRFTRNSADFRTFVNTLRRTVANPKYLIGSKTTIHDCSHNESVETPCVETIIWEKT